MRLPFSPHSPNAKAQALRPYACPRSLASGVFHSIPVIFPLIAGACIYHIFDSTLRTQATVLIHIHKRHCVCTIFVSTRKSLSSFHSYLTASFMKSGSTSSFMDELVKGFSPVNRASRLIGVSLYICIIFGSISFGGFALTEYSIFLLSALS